MLEPRVFALGAVAIDDKSMESYIQQANLLKEKFFNRTYITFHEPYMRNRSGIYYFEGDLDRQQAFDEAIETLLNSTDFKVFGVGIRKTAFEEDFIKTGIDPYLPTDVYSVAIMLLIERYLDFLNSLPIKHMGRVTLESIGSREDALHQSDYARLLLEGSQWVSDKAFRSYLETGLRFLTKQGSNPLEISDMFSRDLFEWVRSECTATPKRWRLFNQKIYCRGDGMMGKFGLKVFPDTDLRDLIENHRRSCGAGVERE